ncbi:tyrosine-type recombinase/integrase, partial [Micrococcus sp. F3Y]|uniref:tyrosine-type recombinase/integrase n=1 Tax=Micrococcus sp. F3Y TaxID=3402627 RepID=UPI003AF7259B
PGGRERRLPVALDEVRAVDDAAAGIAKHLTPHSLRHTFASWALMDGVPAQVVQHRLGHESLQTTSRVYAHLLLDAQRAAVDAIGWEPSPGT